MSFFLIRCNYVKLFYGEPVPCTGRELAEFTYKTQLPFLRDTFHTIFPIRLKTNITQFRALKR